MAYMMVHLLVARRWAEGHPEFLESPEFYYGAIAPDAIHVRDGNDKSHKNEIHLNNWGSPHPEDVIAYWLERAEPFDIGYGVHVLTDAQWVPRFRQRLPGLVRPDGKLDTGIYYNDTFVTDFRMYATRPRLEALLKLVEQARTPETHPLLTAYEFSQWRGELLKAYRGPCPFHDPVRYIDEAYVDAFVEDSIPMIDDVYENLMKRRS